MSRPVVDPHPPVVHLGDDAAGSIRIPRERFERFAAAMNRAIALLERHCSLLKQQREQAAAPSSRRPGP